MNLDSNGLDLKRLLAVFLFLETIAVVFWGLCFIPWPSLAEIFVPSELPTAWLWAFLPVDLVLYGGSGWMARTALLRGRKSVTMWLSLHTGMILYAEFYVLGIALQLGQGWLGAIMMAPSALLMPWALWRWHRL